jgi:hypothetical protein|tara:strand:- start:306 stop:551 length:246 start_codon:yes stop_codon:yes gene_type:complete
LGFGVEKLLDQFIENGFASSTAHATGKMLWAAGIWLGSPPGQAQVGRERDTFRVNATQNRPAKRAFLGAKRNEPVSRLGFS